MKRFWDHASVEPEAGGYRVRLDGRPMHLPGGIRLLLPTNALADAVAAEWQAAGGAKGGEMSFEDVPLSRLAGTAQERIAPDPAPTARALAEYGRSDLLCYRADRAAAARRAPGARMAALARLGAAANYGARLAVTAGVMPVAQDPRGAACAGAGAAARRMPGRWPGSASPCRRSAAWCSASRWPPGR